MLCQCGWISLNLQAYWFDLLLIARLRLVFYILALSNCRHGVFFSSYDFHIIFALFCFWYDDDNVDDDNDKWLRCQARQMSKSAYIIILRDWSCMNIFNPNPQRSQYNLVIKIIRYCVSLISFFLCCWILREKDLLGIRIFFFWVRVFFVLWRGDFIESWCLPRQLFAHFFHSISLQWSDINCMILYFGIVFSSICGRNSIIRENKLGRQYAMRRIWVA